MQKIETLFTSPECDIFYNCELHIIQTLWKGIYVKDEPLRSILNEIIVCLAAKNAAIIIADAREMHAINPVDQQWIVDTWYPRAVNSGFRYQGLILKKDTYNELAVKKITAEYDDRLVTTQYFSTHVDALEWVREIQKEIDS